MSTATHEYSDGTNTYEGFMALPGEASPMGLIIVGHAWGGLSDHERDVARRLSEAGYAAFAYDIYGKGKRGQTTEECQALMGPLMEDRSELQARLAVAIDFAQGETGIAAANTIIIGYCFGGLCAIDSARAGLNIAGAVSFHGLFGAPDNLSPKRKVTAKVLALHGYDDPMAKPADMKSFCDEMTTTSADWQLLAFGHTMHAFTNTAANDPDFGTVYSQTADKRSWQAMMAFVGETIGE